MRTEMNSNFYEADASTITHHVFDTGRVRVEGFAVDGNVLDAACEQLHSLSARSEDGPSDREIASERRGEEGCTPSDLRRLYQPSMRVGTERPRSLIQRIRQRSQERACMQLQTNRTTNVVETAGGVRQGLSRLRDRVANLAERCSSLETASSECRQHCPSKEAELKAEHVRMMEIVLPDLAEVQESGLALSPAEKQQSKCDLEGLNALKSYINSLTGATTSAASSPGHSHARSASPSPARCETAVHSASPVSTPPSSRIDLSPQLHRSPHGEVRHHAHLTPPAWFNPPPLNLDFSLAPPPTVPGPSPVSPSGVDFNFAKSTSHPSIGGFARSTSHPPMSLSAHGSHRAQNAAAHAGACNSFNEGDQCTPRGQNSFYRASSHGPILNPYHSLNAARPEFSSTSSWQQQQNNGGWNWQSGVSLAPPTAWNAPGQAPCHPGWGVAQGSDPNFIDPNFIIPPYVPGSMLHQHQHACY